MAHHGSRRRRRLVRWSVLPRLAAGTLGWPMMIVMLVLATASCMAAAAAAADEEQAWYLPPPPPPPLHSQKMVADETWIQSHRRLSDKGVLPTDQATPMQTTTIQSSMVFGSCAFHRDDNDNDDKNENDKDDDKDDDSLWGSSSGDFVFKLSAGQGHGIVCIPNLGRRMYPKTGDFRDEEADEEEEHQHQQLIRPPMELQIVGVEENGGGAGSSGDISYTTTTTYTKKNSEEEDDEQGSSNETSSTSSIPTNSSYIRNCFGLSDDEGSIGYPFVYTNIPPHGALVQVTCHRRRPWSSSDFVAGEPPPQSLDFVILVLDEAAQQQGILVTESFVVNEEENNNEVTATTKDNDEKNETETTTTTSSSSSSSQSSHPSSWGREIVIRPTVLDAHSKIRGIQVQAYETKWPSSTQLDRAKNYPPPDEGDPEDSHHPDSATTSTTTTMAAASQLPWQAHSLVHARTNKIIHRVLDGQHDNVLAISVSVLERDEREQQQQQKEKQQQQQKDRDKNNNATETLPESNDENNHHKNDAATSDAQTIRRRRPNDTDPLAAAAANVEFKDLVVLLHYELETKDSKVYQRTLVVSSPTLSTTTTTTLPASSSTEPWWATPQSWFWTDWWPWKSSSPDNNGPWPVWIASTHISQEGDVQVALAGIGAVPTMTMMMMNDDENNNDNNSDSDEERTAGKSAHQDANKEEEEEEDSRFWRHRRFLCTIRVALVVAVAEESETPVVQDDNDTTNKDDIRKKKDTPQPPSEQVTTDKQPTPTPPPTTPTTTGAKERLHSLVDVAAMVTSDSPVVVVHVGWIRKGLHALDLSKAGEEESGNNNDQDEEDESWDVFVEDVLCQDPNHGYRVTHTLTVTTAAATENQDGHRRRVHREDGADAGGRRRLFAHNSQGIRMLGSNHSIIMSTTTARKLLSQPPTQEELQVHDEMRMGRRPSSTTRSSDLDEKRNTKGEGDQTRRRQLQQQQRRRLGEQQTISQPIYSHRFILIHGYCSRNTWPAYHFSGDSYSVVRFNDPHKSNSHDEFAYAIRESACPYQDGKVSGNIVAHSQGGAASLHMHNFYWSCLDNNPHPGRWIQTLGTPFQGTNLAGVAASMGAIFGVGCGSVHDLTQDGAMGWLQHVQPWARKRVTYYRTQYQEHVNLFNYCHLLTHSLIGAPNDGVVQVGRGILQGGIDGGIKKTQCHVPDMRDPPQVEDHIRNAYMKSVAAIPPQKTKRRILGIRTSSNSTNGPLPLLPTTDEYDDDDHEDDDDDAIIKQSSVDEENYFPQ